MKVGMLADRMAVGTVWMMAEMKVEMKVGHLFAVIWVRK